MHSFSFSKKFYSNIHNLQSFKRFINILASYSFITGKDRDFKIIS